MDPQDIRTLKLFEAIEADPGSSQRDLARQLNVSLGLTNSFLKRLARKGYFKVTHIPKNRVRYLLTAKGAVEKTRLSYEYISHSISFYREARQRMKKLFQDLAQKGRHRVVLYGLNDLTEIAYISMQEFGVQIEAIVDADPPSQTFMGIKVQTPDQMNWKGSAPVLVTDLERDGKSLDRLEALGVAAERILRLH